MRALATLITKDLREQRLALLAPFGLGLAGCAGAALFVDASWLDTPVLAQVLALVLGALCALAIGCDLGSRERGEGSLPWLLRQPFGFGKVIASKLLVLGLGMLLGLGVGALCAFGTYALVAGSQAVLGLGRTEGVLVVIVVSLGLWSASASTWMPRGFLAAPAGIVSFVLVSAPAWVPIVWYELRPDPALWTSLVVALPLGGLCAAVAGMASGVRGASGPLRRASWALGAGALGCLPLWIPAGRQTLDVLRFDPTAERFLILDAFLSPDGRHVLLNTWKGRSDWRRRRVDGRPIAVDLASGAWRAVGPRGSQVRTVPGSEGLLLEDAGGVLGLLRPDGTPVARQDPPLAAATDPQQAPQAPPGLSLRGRAGLGWMVQAEGNQPYNGYFDPRTGTVFSPVELRHQGLEFAPTHAVLTAGPWILTQDRPARLGGARHVLYDAVRRELSAPDWLADLEQLVGVLTDGRILGRYEEGAASHLALFDAVSGERTRLPIANAPKLMLTSVHVRIRLGRSYHSPLDDPEGPTVLTAGTADRSTGFLWLHLESEGGPHLLWSECSTASQVVGELGSGELLVARDGALWTQPFTGHAPRLLFPR